MFSSPLRLLSLSAATLAAVPALVRAAPSNKTCVGEAMCVTATVGATSTLYEVESINDLPPGWMGLGFGKKMADSAMVIMWANEDGSVTLSQRTAPGHVQPTVTTKPARVATLAKKQTNVKGDNPVIAFTVPNAEGAELKAQDLIWAMSLQAPSGPQSYATLGFHDVGYGHFVLDVAASSSSSSTSAPSSTGSSTATSTQPTSAAPTSTSSSSGTATTGTTGGKTCVGDPQVMCIQATVNSSTTVYQLTAAGSTTPGYMALGFGTEMSDAPMVIVWKDTSGGVVLSQRTAPGHVQPKPDTAPARVAILDAAQTSALASQPVYTFTVPTSGDAANQKLIWAAASASPDDSSPNATIKFHDLGFGSFILDASSSLAQNGTPADTNASKQLPLASWEKMVIAHAVFFVIGFLVLLPIGALVARLLRTSVPWWFKVHWAVQFYITLPFMVIAFALGVAAVESHGGEHFNDFHKRTGLALFILYFAQCALGAIIHFIKSPNRRRRPGQNYIHAILGLTIIGLAIAQIRSGYAVEWDKATRRGKVGNAVNVLWVVWVVALPLLYIGGLFLLPRQWRQEREAREMREKRGMTDSQTS